MSTSEKILISVLAIIVLISTALFYSGKCVDEKTFGSVVQGSEYQSTTTSPTLRDLSVLKTGSGALGSVVITVTGAAPFTLYDATSTVNNAEWATTTLASFGASPTVGTYTFDVIFRKGLLIDFDTATALATSTITWR